MRTYVCIHTQVSLFGHLSSFLFSFFSIVLLTNLEESCKSTIFGESDIGAGARFLLLLKVIHTCFGGLLRRYSVRSVSYMSSGGDADVGFRRLVVSGMVVGRCDNGLTNNRGGS